MTKEILLTHGHVALVDDADFEWLNQWKWHVTPRGYARRAVPREGGQRWVLMHRQILDAPPHLWSDHINGNRLDNRRSNLRLVTPLQNGRNKVVARSNRMASRFKGVAKRHNKWTAAIYPHGKRIHLGYFFTEEDAAHAYDRAARQYFGEYAGLNFPTDEVLQ